MKDVKFHLKTLRKDAFYTDFMKSYFEAENEPLNLFYYPYEKLATELQLSDIVTEESVNTSTISKIVAKEHGEIVNGLKRKKTECVTELDKIPYQMILAEYTDDKNETNNESLIIYAVNEEDNISKLIRRNIIGISSKNKQMFNAFETLFNDVKPPLPKQKDS